MNQNARGRLVARLAGVFLAGVVVLAAVFWKDILAQYHLARLLREDSYLPAIAGAPSGSAKRRALAAFVRSERGKVRVVREILQSTCELLDEKVAKRNVAPIGGTVFSPTSPSDHSWLRGPSYSEKIRGSLFLSGLLYFVEDERHWARLDVRGPGERTASEFVDVGKREHLADLARLLADFDPTEIILPDHPELRFQVVDASETRSDPSLPALIAGRLAVDKVCVLRAGPDRVDRLIAELRSRDARVRADAAEALVWLRSPEETILPALETAMTGPDAVRIVRLLAAFGDAAVPPIERALERSRGALAFKVAAAKTLVEVGPAGSPAILRLLDDPSPAVRSATAAILPSNGYHFVPALLGRLRGESLDVAREYARSIARIVDLGSGVHLEALRGTLDHEDAVVRARIALAIGRLGPAAAPATEDLTSALEDPDERVRIRSAQALGEIGPAARAAIPALEKALADDDGLVRLHARNALEAIDAERRETHDSEAGDL